MHLKGVSVQTFPGGEQRLTAEVLVDAPTLPTYVTGTFRRGMSLKDTADRLRDMANLLDQVNATNGRD